MFGTLSGDPGWFRTFKFLHQDKLFGAPMKMPKTVLHFTFRPAWVAVMFALGTLLPAQDITGSWFFTGLSVSVDTGPFSIDAASGRVSGTLTITGDNGSGYTLTPGGAGWLNLADAAGPIPFTQDGGRYAFSLHEPDMDSDTDTHAAVQWINADTALIFYANAESINTGPNDGGLWWLDAFGGVLTRDSLPAGGTPDTWVGLFANTEIAVSTEAEDGLEFTSGTLPISAGVGLGEYVVDGGDTFTAIDGGRSLHFMENDPSWHDEALIVQLEGGAKAFAYFGVESLEGVITFADFGVGTLTAIPEPSTYAAIFGALALVAGVLRKRERFTLT